MLTFDQVREPDVNNTHCNHYDEHRNVKEQGSII